MQLMFKIQRYSTSLEYYLSVNTVNNKVINITFFLNPFHSIVNGTMFRNLCVHVIIKIKIIKQYNSKYT